MKENGKEKESIKNVPCSKPFAITAEEYAKAMEYFNSSEYKKIQEENRKILKKVKKQINEIDNESVDENSI